MARQPLQVLRVITRLNIGGPGLHVLTLARGLPDRSSLLAIGRPDDREGELDTSGVEVVPVPLVRPLSPLQDGRALWTLRRLISARRPAIVESHMAKAGLMARAASRSIRHRPAVVHVFHGHVLDGGYFSPPIVKALVATERLLAAASDVLVTVSPETRDSLLAMRIGRPEQYRVIPLGFDLSPFTDQSSRSGTVRSNLGLTDDTPLVGVAARLVPIKDHATLLEAMACLPGVHLAVFGDGFLRPQLEERAIALGMHARIHFLGWWQDMAGGLADCDVVALASRSEGTPVSLIEAMAAGRAVVATDVGGTPFVVDDGVTGLLVPPQDPVALAAALGEVLSDPRRARQMGEAGRRLATTRFGLPRLVAEMGALYDELLGGHIPPRRNRD